jgi:hypothetical protein
MGVLAEGAGRVIVAVRYAVEVIWTKTKDKACRQPTFFTFKIWRSELEVVLTDKAISIHLQIGYKKITPFDTAVSRKGDTGLNGISRTRLLSYLSTNRS